MQAIMQDLLCLHSASQGRRQAGDPSGVALQEMKAADAVPLDLIEIQIAMNVRQDAKNILTYIKAFYPASKMTRQMDRFGKLVFQELHTTALGDDPEVFIEASELFRCNSSSRDTKTMQMLQLGIITPTEARRLLTQHIDPASPLIGLRDLQHAHEILDTILATALTPEGSMAVNISPTDNLPVFEQVFSEYIKSPTGDYYKTSKQTQDAIWATYQQILAIMAGLPPTPATTPQQKPAMPAQSAPQGRGVPLPPKQPEGLPGAEKMQNQVATQELKSAEPPSAKA